MVSLGSASDTRSPTIYASPLAPCREGHSQSHDLCVSSGTLPGGTLAVPRSMRLLWHLAGRDTRSPTPCVRDTRSPTIYASPLAPCREGHSLSHALSLSFGIVPSGTLAVPRSMPLLWHRAVRDTRSPTIYASSLASCREGHSQSQALSLSCGTVPGGTLAVPSPEPLLWHRAGRDTPGHRSSNRYLHSTLL